MLWFTFLPLWCITDYDVYPNQSNPNPNTGTCSVFKTTYAINAVGIAAVQWSGTTCYAQWSVQFGTDHQKSSGYCPTDRKVPHPGHCHRRPDHSRVGNDQGRHRGFGSSSQHHCRWRWRRTVGNPRTLRRPLAIPQVWQLAFRRLPSNGCKNEEPRHGVCSSGNDGNPRPVQAHQGTRIPGEVPNS